MKVYQDKVSQYTKLLEIITKKYNNISFFRLFSVFLFLVLGYYYFKTEEIVCLILAFLSLAVFIVLMKIHFKLVTEKKLLLALLQINKNEISFLKREKIPFENGQEYIDFQHPYAYDLDIFGDNSLFQSLNRTATYVGKRNLAHLLQKTLSNESIIENQNAIKELSSKITWRQEFLALAKVGADSKEQFQELLKWNNRKSNTFSKTVRIVLFAFPALFISFILAYFITDKAILLSFSTIVFVLNLLILGMFMKRIQLEIANTSAIDAIIFQYSLLMQKIEKETFETPKLIALQKKLYFEETKASTHLKKLSELFSNMDSISNVVTAVVFNGAFLYNLHVLKALTKWKNTHNQALESWLEVIGEFESMNSLANLNYNNSDFVFPVLNTENIIRFSNLSHPLLNPETRVGNHVSFYPQSFTILTGSNMSGKSTFLRSLGVNMVLGGIGSVVCASDAELHPLPVLVSMRLSDSLSDSESYFFAEIKRLKQIMDALDKAPAFVLLDEILRGTNSDDKRNGTIEVVKKVIAKKAIGAIATHDIEVCLTTNNYRDVLQNQCFEVAIINNDLHFDYKLREGICKNKSATFLMEKMGVI